MHFEGDMRKRIYSHQKVRTSLQDRTLDSMFPIANPAQVESQDAPVQNPETPLSSKSRDIKESDCSLTSVKVLRHAFIKDKHQGTCLRPLPWNQANIHLVLTEILEKHIFVGIVDLERCLSLIQHSTNLYLVNHTALGSVHHFWLPWATLLTTVAAKSYSINSDWGNLETLAVWD